MVRIPRSPVLLAVLAAAAAAQSEAPKPAAPAASVRVVGRVVTWDGQPVAGAAVAIVATGATDTNELLREPPATTDADGRYALTVPAPRPDDAEPRVLHIAAKGMAAVAQNVPWKRKQGPAAAAEEAAVEIEIADDGEAVEPAPPDAGAARGQPTIEYEPETRIDDLVLTTGQRLFGRVRDAAGKPLARVRIVATDLLEHGNSFRGNRRHGFHCAAFSDASGIFSLPGALPLAARLEFTFDGCYRELLQPVAAGTPLEVTMQPSGWIQGRVLDKDGRSVAEASVTVDFELRGAQRPVRSAADGSFRVGVERPGRWRIRASKRTDGRTAEGHSDVLQGPRENLEVIVAGKADAEQQLLPVRAVDKKTGRPVTDFRAAAVWEQWANQNAAYLDYRLRSQLRDDAKKPVDGVVDVAGPGKHGSPSGAVRVIAAGYAPATRKEVEWKEPEPNQPREPLTIELEEEATVAGTLRDERSGEPVAGAKVFARPRHDPSQGRYEDGQQAPPDATTTGADGTFVVRGLGEGAFEVFARDPQRPRAPAVEIELGAHEQKTGLQITMPSGAPVRGTLTGAPIGHGARAFLVRLPKQTFGEGNHYYSYYGGQNAGEGVAVGADGSFRIDGVALDNQLLVLRLPSPPRLGGDLFLPLEPFRVRAAGIDRQFDCSEDRPGRIRGKIAFPAAALPFEQVVVVARLVSEEEGHQFFSPFENNFPGPRSFVAADGSFELRVGPGSYQLQAVDLATGTLLHTDEKKATVPTGGTTERELKLELAKIELVLKPAADQKEMAAIERIEVRVLPKAMKAMGANFGGNDNYDPGNGIRWPLGATRLEVVLPLGDATLFCRNNVAGLRVDDERWNNAPLGRAEFEITTGAGAKTTCEIEVGPPPEIPDPKAAKEGDGSDQGQAAGPDLIIK